MNHFILRKDIYLKNKDKIVEKYKLSRKLSVEAVGGVLGVGTQVDITPNDIVKEIKVNKSGKYIYHLEPIYFTSKNFMINEIKDYFIPKKWIVAQADL